MKLSTKLLIIFYASGLVLLGYQPIKKQYGSLSSYLSKSSNRLLSSAKREQRRLDQPQVKKLRMPKADPQAQKARAQLAKPVLEKLTQRDRDNLDSLIKKVD